MSSLPICESSFSVGYSDMRQRTAEAVELSRAEHRKEIIRIEEDREHFVSALAESMNQVTWIMVNGK